MISKDWLNKKYGKYREVKTTRGKVHNFLGMVLDFNTKGELKVKQIDYINDMVDKGPF